MTSRRGWRPWRHPARADWRASLIASGALLTIGWAGARVFSEGPPPAHTGGFKEPSCLVCHSGGPLNDSLGSLTVSDVPARYAPGKGYRIAVLVSRRDMQMGGFQIAARFAAGERAGQQAGTLRATDDRARIIDTAGLQYAGHTATGSALSSQDSARWVIEWTAPAAAAGAVVFHVAANAANADASPLGDNIYTRSATSRP